MSNTPNIRFKGFSDDWEQRKLGDISEKITRKNQDIVADEVFTNSAEFGIISQRDYFDKDIANAENIAGYYVVEPDDFVYNPRISTTAPFGPIKRNKLDRTGAMSPLYYIFRPHGVDLTYLELFFQTTCWHAFMRFNGNSGARSDRFAITDRIFNEMPISMPQDVEEQKLIGKYLSELESLITLHQRKCDEVKSLKESMLQKLFPKRGHAVPEIRFSGFNEPWKLYKIKDIFEKVGVPVNLENDVEYREIGIRSHGKGIFYKEPVTGKQLGNKRVFWIEPNCVIVNIVFAWERAVARTTEKESGMIASHRFPMYRPIKGIVDLDFITKFFTTKAGKEILEMASPGGAGRNKTLGQKEFSNSRVWLPPYEEQIKIGQLIDHLDDTIFRYQRKYEELTCFKQYMLQNMFVK